MAGIYGPWCATTCASLYGVKNTYDKGLFEYDLLIFVANWPAVRTLPWKQLLIARAIENQAYVLGVNRVGQDGLGIDYAGDSCLIDPKGHVIAQAKSGEEALIEESISLTELNGFRENSMWAWIGTVLKLFINSHPSIILKANTNNPEMEIFAEQHHRSKT